MFATHFPYCSCPSSIPPAQVLSCPNRWQVRTEGHARAGRPSVTSEPVRRYGQQRADRDCLGIRRSDGERTPRETCRRFVQASRPQHGRSVPIVSIEASTVAGMPRPSALAVLCRSLGDPDGFQGRTESALAVLDRVRPLCWVELIDSCESALTDCCGFGQR